MHLKEEHESKIMLLKEKHKEETMVLKRKLSIYPPTLAEKPKHHETEIINLKEKQQVGNIAIEKGA